VTFLCLVLVVVVAYVDRLQTDMSTRNVYLCDAENIDFKTSIHREVANERSSSEIGLK
jgi:hypothetical protein